MSWKLQLPYVSPIYAQSLPRRHTHRAHFITSTIIEWMPIFTSGACCNILVEAFRHAQQHKALQVYAWVILDNHFHAVFAAPELSRILASIKSFTAKALVTQIESEGRGWLLNQLEYYCAKHKTGSRYQVWQEGFHPQELSTDESMLQKINYIHHNPVARGMVTAAEHWRYSSAHEWLAGSRPALQCDQWR